MKETEEKKRYVPPLARRARKSPASPASILPGIFSSLEGSFTSYASDLWGRKVGAWGREACWEKIHFLRVARALTPSIHQHRPEGRTYTFLWVYKEQQTDQAWIKTCCLLLVDVAPLIARQSLCDFVSTSSSVNCLPTKCSYRQASHFSV